MKLVTTFHPPSSVVDALKINLTPDGEEHLVVAKPDRLEVFSIQPDGLRLDTTVHIWGRILKLRELPVQNSRRSNLIVLTDHPDPRIIVLEYKRDADRSTLIERKMVSLHDRNSRIAEFLTDLWVHPSGTVAVASCYAGRLTVFVINDGTIQNDFHVSLPEINLLALCFVPADPSPADEDEEGIYALALLHIDHQARIQLLARDLDVPNYELRPGLSTALGATPLPASSFTLDFREADALPHLVPVPPSPDRDCLFRGGVLVLGGRKLALYELPSSEQRRKWHNKHTRTDSRKQGRDKEAALAKEREREGRKRKPRTTVEWPWAEVTAWCPIERECKGLLIGDAWGRLALLSIDKFKENGLTLLPLGETSPPTCLAYLTAQVLYLGSHRGDAQLLRISPTPLSAPDAPTLPIAAHIPTVAPAALAGASAASPKGKGKRRALDDELDMDDDARSGCKGRVVAARGRFVEALETFEGLAPAHDACVVDPDGSGQPQVVVCAGGRNRGAIKVVRKGAEFQHVAVAQGLAGVVRAWPVRKRYRDKTDAYILASTLRGTYLFSLSADQVLEPVDAELAGLRTDAPTLAVSNVAKRNYDKAKDRHTYEDSGLVVQATPNAIILLEHNDGGVGAFTEVDHWTPSSEAKWAGKEIVAASVNGSQIAVALSGGVLVLLMLSPIPRNRLENRGHHVWSSLEISAISILPLDPANDASGLIAVGFWTTNDVRLVNILSAGEGKDYVLRAKDEHHSRRMPAHPCSLLLYNFGESTKRTSPDYHAHVLVGLADGNFVSFVYSNNGIGKVEMKVAPLGVAPVSIVSCQANDRKAVFCCGTRSAIVYWDKARLQNAPALLKNVVTACSVNTSDFEQCVVLVHPDGLTIGRFGHLEGLHTRSIPFGLDNPKRITYHDTAHVFGVAFTRYEPARVGDEEPPSKSSLRLLDSPSFDEIYRWDAGPDEEITTVEVLTLGTGKEPAAYFCVGTADLNDADKVETTKGELIVFSVNKTTPLSLSKTASATVDGCVYAVVAVKGLLAAAVNSAVLLYRLEGGSLVKIHTWNHNYVVSSLVARDDRLFVGDAISSVSVLKLVERGLETVARDYGPVWPIAIQATGHNSVIGSDSDCNIFSFSLVDKKLEKDGSFHIGDVVNNFIPGGPSATEVSGVGHNLLKPIQTFFTSSGRVGVIIDVPDEQLALDLTGLHRNMSQVLPNFGGVHNDKWRAPANSRGRTDAEGSRGFLDADFLETLLELPADSSKVQKIFRPTNEPERLKSTYESMKQVLDSLQAMH